MPASQEPNPNGNPGTGPFTKTIYWIGGVAALMTAVAAFTDAGQKLLISSKSLFAEFRKIYSGQIDSKSKDLGYSKEDHLCIYFGQSSGSLRGRFLLGTFVCDQSWQKRSKVTRIEQNRILFDNDNLEPSWCYYSDSRSCSLPWSHNSEIYIKDLPKITRGELGVDFRVEFKEN